MALSQIDYSLYLVTDRSLSKGRTTVEIVKSAIEGGVTCVQLREKECDTREFIKEALAIRELLQEKRIPLFINDRLDIAQAVGADGIHLGQSDMPIAMARKIVGDTMVIGISAESLEDALQAEKEGADYISASPVYDTPTKSDTAPALGLLGVKAIRNAISVPLVAIGGLNADTIEDVIRNGADGVAVVSAIVSADDPVRAAADLKKITLAAKQI